MPQLANLLHTIQQQLFNPAQLTTKNQIVHWLEKHKVNCYTINDDLTVDVNNTVYLLDKKLTHLPLQFGKITGDFFICHNKLKNLIGSPRTIGGSFYCQDNRLTSLEGCPEIVPSKFHCNTNKLTTLEFGPKIVGGEFDCSRNQLISLKGCPQKIDGHFFCIDNKLSTLEYWPEEIYGLADLHFNEQLGELAAVFNTEKLYSEHIKQKIGSLENKFCKPESPKRTRTKL